jgi:hypothetical protein
VTVTVIGRAAAGRPACAFGVALGASWIDILVSPGKGFTPQWVTGA